MSFKIIYWIPNAHHKVVIMTGISQQEFIRENLTHQKKLFSEIFDVIRGDFFYKISAGNYDIRNYHSCKRIKKTHKINFILSKEEELVGSDNSYYSGVRIMGSRLMGSFRLIGSFG
jgi:hypothetical protein